MNNLDKSVFAEAGSWAADREALRERSLKRTWLIIWLLAAIAVAEGLALIALMPLKTVVPYTVLVDRQTGYVTTLDPSRPATLGADQALTRSLLVQYVAAREGFSFAQVRSDYRKVMSWSAGIARATYARDMTASNPDGPLGRYSRATLVEVVPKSVSELSDRSAMVRFDVVRTEGEGRVHPPVPYAAVINYRFMPRDMGVEERFLNPLGFEVSRYRRDPEAVSSATPIMVANPAEPDSSRPAAMLGPAQ